MIISSLVQASVKEINTLNLCTIFFARESDSNFTAQHGLKIGTHWAATETQILSCAGDQTPDYFFTTIYCTNGTHLSTIDSHVKHSTFNKMNHSQFQQQRQQLKKKARPESTAMVFVSPEPVPIPVTSNSTLVTSHDHEDPADIMHVETIPMAVSEAIKEHVDTYLNDIRKETWEDYKWECKLISQIPDFVRIYQEAPTDINSFDPLSDSLDLSIQAMKERLRYYLPPVFLEYHPTLLQEKLDAARDTIEFLAQTLRDMDQAAYNRKKKDRDTKDQYYYDDDDDSYIDPYLGDPMYGDDDDDDYDSNQDPSDLPSSFYHQHIDEMKDFFKALPYNLVFNAGFHYPGCAIEDAKKCYCPCSWKMKTWQTQFYLDGLCKGTYGKKEEYCSDNNFLHHALMSHLEKVGERDDTMGLIHRGIHKYIHILYKNHNSGLGHKALFKYGDDNYRKIEKFETKRENDIIQDLYMKIVLEEEQRLESERLLKDMESQLVKKGLERLNKDKFDEITALSKNFRTLDLQLSVKKKLSSEALLKHQQQVVRIFQSIRACATKNQDVTLRIPFDFELQKLMHEWYNASISSNPSDDVLFLFQDFCNKGDVSKFLAEWNIQFYISSLHASGKRRRRKEIKEMEEDTMAVDKGGPTAQFLNEFWKQLDGLKASVSVNDRVYMFKLFEISDKALLPYPDDVLTQGIGDDRVREAALGVARKWYRAIGRVMIHSIMGSRIEGVDKHFPLPSHIIPRFFRSVILSGTNCSEKDYYPWAEVVADMQQLGLGSMVDALTEMYQGDIPNVFQVGIPEYVIDSRCIALSALREGISIGGVLDFAGNSLKNLPIYVQEGWEFTKDQLDIMTQSTPDMYLMTPFFKGLPLDVLDSLFFCKASVRLEDIMEILQVQFWEYSELFNGLVPDHFIAAQRSIWDQVESVLDECGREKEGFLEEFLEFFTGYSFLPEMTESSKCVA